MKAAVLADFLKKREFSKIAVDYCPILTYIICVDNVNTIEIQ
jgi:hypothetical protein